MRANKKACREACREAVADDKYVSPTTRFRVILSIEYHGEDMGYDEYLLAENVSRAEADKIDTPPADLLEQGYCYIFLAPMTGETYRERMIREMAEWGQPFDDDTVQRWLTQQRRYLNAR